MTSKEMRIDNFNKWPSFKLFEAEDKFKNLIDKYKVENLFSTCRLNNIDDKDYHIVISYLLDMLDSLPLRPDHSFDWAWRGFEYLLGMKKKENITQRLNTFSKNELPNIFKKNNELKNEFFHLVNVIPTQTCRYLFKRTFDSKPFMFKSENKELEKKKFKQLSTFTKRLISENGNSENINSNLQLFFLYLEKKYNDFELEKDRKKRSDIIRKGAHLIKVMITKRKIRITYGKSEKEVNEFIAKLTEEEKSLLKENKEIVFNDEEILLYLISALGYGFRNDRAHAQSISPFSSSSASLKTYSHCWFMFLMIFELITFCLLDYEKFIDKKELMICLNKNRNSFINLFGTTLTK